MVAEIASPSRQQGLDALRAALTLLVVFHHCALTYGAIGDWYYREVPTDGRLQIRLLVFFCAVNQAFFMGLFFLLAGAFTPGAVARKGVAGYLRDRALRLGGPLLVYVALLGPLTIALAQTAHGQQFGGTLWYLWQHGVIDVGPLWFALALLIFGLAYLPWHGFIGVSRFPSNRAMLAAALATGVGAFLLRLVWPVGVTVYSLQLGYFASYIVLFAAGCAGSASGWLTAIPAAQRRRWRWVADFTLLVLPLVVLLAPFFPVLQGSTNGGWNLQALVYAFWEPFLAWGIILALLGFFTRRFTTSGPVWSRLTRRAYTIFIVHPPVLVGIALAWRTVPAAPLLKFAVTGTLACWACYVIAGLLLRVPAIRRVV